MQITIKIKDGSKALAFLNFIKSLDFISIQKSDEITDYPGMTDDEIIDRVRVTNQQIKNGETISQSTLLKKWEDRWK